MIGFDEVRERLHAASPGPWEVTSDPNGELCLTTGRTTEPTRLYIRRDLDPAGGHDLAFIALARNVIGPLLEAIESGAPEAVTDEQLDEIEAVTNRATKGPWKPFIEEKQPIGGSSVIWVGEDDDEPDMYVWLGDDMAGPGDFEFVAYAREDVPRLVAALRELRWPPSDG